MNRSNLSICFILIAVCLLSCGHKKIFKSFLLVKEFRIVLPINENSFNDSLTYSGIEIWNKEKIVFRDTVSEFLFDKAQDPLSRVLKVGTVEVLLKKFDAPDLNKTLALYLSETAAVNKVILPEFTDHKDFDGDGVEEFAGILHISEAYNLTGDSCYYNPVLYYEKSDNGFFLDSVLTVRMNEKKWGAFYGFKQSEQVLPCK